MRWNDHDRWVWSERPAHDAIIPVGQFEAAQEIFRSAQRPARRRQRTRHPYVLSGLVRCATCGRKMQGSWNHETANCRCKFPASHAGDERQHAKTVYVRESSTSVVPGLDRWIGTLFDEDHLRRPPHAVAGASEPGADDAQVRELHLRRQLRECDAKLAKYRKLLEHDGELNVVVGWIAEIEGQRRVSNASLAASPGTVGTRRMSKALVRHLKDVVAVLADADPADKRAVYDELGGSACPTTPTAESTSRPATVYLGLVSRGECNPKYTGPVGGMADGSVTRALSSAPDQRGDVAPRAVLASAR